MNVFTTLVMQSFTKPHAFTPSDQTTAMCLTYFTRQGTTLTSRGIKGLEISDRPPISKGRYQPQTQNAPVDGATSSQSNKQEKQKLPCRLRWSSLLLLFKTKR